MVSRIIALAIALPIAALAQPKTDPADARAAAPPLRYESALGGYRSFKDEKPAPWKEVNDAVKGAGHAAHGAPAKAPSKADPAPPGKKPTEHKH